MGQPLSSAPPQHHTRYNKMLPFLWAYALVLAVAGFLLDSPQGILEGLGYLPTARYEKFRESWQLDGVQVDMDILPFGQVVELEGEAERIRKVEVLLELDKQPTSADSYHVLHQRWRAEQGLPPERSFVFSPSQAAQWRAVLQLPPEED